MSRFETHITAFGKGLTQETLDKATGILNELRLLLMDTEGVTINSRLNVEYPETPVTEEKNAKDSKK